MLRSTSYNLKLAGNAGIAQNAFKEFAVYRGEVYNFIIRKHEEPFFPLLA